MRSRSTTNALHTNDEFTYALFKSGPGVNPDEVELEQVAAVEVMILWGATVLHVRHFAPPRSFYVGEEAQGNFGCDYCLPADKIGAVRAPIVLADDTSIAVVILPNARGWVEIPGQPRMILEDAVRSGRARPCAEFSRAHQMALPPEGRARMEVGGFVFCVAAVRAGKPAAHGLFASSDVDSFVYAGLSLAAHASVFGAMAFFVPPLGLTDGEALTGDQPYLIEQYLRAAAEREKELKENEQVDQAQAHAGDHEGGSGTRAAGEEGSMGNPNTRETGHRYGVKGPKNNPDVHVSRHASANEASEFGMIGVLHAGAGGDPNAPTAIWGRDESLGKDPRSAPGNMWGNDIGDSPGSGGLGLSSTGDGGGNPSGTGIGLESIGTLDHGGGVPGDDFGSGHGHLPGAYAPRGPRIRPAETTINGRLMPEVIQRIVHQNFGRFRLCYENGLRTNPSLQGRVAVRFVIGRDGMVSNASNGDSDLPNASVVRCVVRAYYDLSFPRPDGGIVSVVYPILFSPGE